MAPLVLPVVPVELNKPGYNKVNRVIGLGMNSGYMGYTAAGSGFGRKQVPE